MAAILFAALLQVAADGAEVTVTNTNDNLAGSLRQAVQDAAPGDTIVFQIPGSGPGYDPATNTWTITLTSAPSLAIAKNLTIDGGSSRIVVARLAGGFNPGGLFVVSAGTVNIANLTMSRSSSSGIRVTGGTMNVRNCLLRDNQGSGTDAGGIQLNSGGTANVVNCTFNSNTGGSGGGIETTGTLVVTNSTFVGNSTGINAFGASTRVRNTIIVGNTSADATGTFISEGYNLIGTAANSTGFGTTGDQLGATLAQANLGALRDNGGLTYTIRPIPPSPAIEQGNRGLDNLGQPVNTDQRGQPRPIDQPAIPNAVGGDGSDIGAVENGFTQSGAQLVVTTRDMHTDGDCSVDDCTLFEALNATNANVDANIITFAPDVLGQITTPFVFGLGINNTVSIKGPGATRLAIAGIAGARIFNVSGLDVLISGLTLRNGSPTGDGGAIINTGDLTVNDCAFISNTANGGTGNGGAINNASGASLALTRCTFSGNTAGQFGGALHNDGVFAATNCTFAGNVATRGGAIISRFNNGASSATLRNCTLAINLASSTSGGIGDGGGGYYAEGGAAQHHLANTIIAVNNNSVNPDIRGSFTSDGHNFIGSSGSSSAGFVNGINGDFVGTNANRLDPQLGSFGNNGGQTNTYPLQATSAAINTGNDALAPVTDQRGYLRVGASDIGAYEFAGTPPPLQFSSAVSRKTHGAAGIFDINLPATGTPGVEDRSGGATNDYTLVFTFSNNLASGNASVTSGTGNVAGIPAILGNTMTVNLSGVTNAQTLSVTLNNLTDQFLQTLPDTAVPMSVLIGDVNGNAVVSASDISSTKAQSGAPASNANFRNDVNANGTISASDISTVKSHSGESLP